MIKKEREFVIEEVKQVIHNIYTANLYCQEDMTFKCKEHGCNCDDCLYVMINEMLEHLKVQKENK